MRTPTTTPRRIVAVCEPTCGHPMSAVSPDALARAQLDHNDYNAWLTAMEKGEREWKS